MAGLDADSGGWAKILSIQPQEFPAGGSFEGSRRLAVKLIERAPANLDLPG